MSSLIREQVDAFVKENPTKKFSFYEADPVKIKKIADRFNQHKATNVPAITNLDKFCTYTIAALAVGDLVLYNNLIDQLSYNSAQVYIQMFSEIELEDDCYDDFLTKEDRLLHYSHPDLYDIIKTKELKYEVTLKKTSSGYDVTEIYFPELDFRYDVYADDPQKLRSM